MKKKEKITGKQGATAADSRCCSGSRFISAGWNFYTLKTDKQRTKGPFCGGEHFLPSLPSEKKQLPQQQQSGEPGGGGRNLTGFSSNHFSKFASRFVNDLRRGKSKSPNFLLALLPSYRKGNGKIDGHTL